MSTQLRDATEQGAQHESTTLLEQDGLLGVPDPSMLVVVGASGDLARRKLLPENTGRKAGMNITARTTTVQFAALPVGSSHQPSMSATSVRIVDRLRRRLSNIFHQPSAERPVAGGNIQGSSCQSPRAQR